MQIDRIYGWQSTPDNPVRASLANQTEATLSQFQDRAKQVRGVVAVCGGHRTNHNHPQLLACLPACLRACVRALPKHRFVVIVCRTTATQT